MLLLALFQYLVNTYKAEYSIEFLGTKLKLLKSNIDNSNAQSLHLN